MIERIHNQNFNHLAKVTEVEKVTRSKKVEEVLTKPDQPTPQEAAKFDKEKIQEVVKGINDFLSPINTSIKFVLHEKLNDYYIKVIDEKTNEVIKEIPSKKLLDMYANMMDYVGLLVDKKI
ncbi:flagellar protein FlaG [Niallia sp. XMNu-256]|uniref:flagellar protein FlaG n=1 Tax=Niallia sp. XMNu-256 TaxID=3082444 RepID=UPI0030D1E094